MEVVLVCRVAQGVFVVSGVYEVFRSRTIIMICTLKTQFNGYRFCLKLKKNSMRSKVPKRVNYNVKLKKIGSKFSVV